MFENRPVVLAVVWVIFGILELLFYFACKDVTLKRKLHPWIHSVMGVLLIGIVLWAIAPIPASVVFGLIPAVAFAVYMNIKFTRFCKGCGKTVYYWTFSRKVYCFGCGTQLQ